MHGGDTARTSWRSHAARSRAFADPRGAGLDARCDLELESEGRQIVAEHVVEIAFEPRVLARTCHLVEHAPCSGIRMHELAPRIRFTRADAIVAH